MKLLHRSVRVLVLAVVLAAGAWLAVLAASADLWNTLAVTVAAGRWDGLFLGLALLCLGALFLLTGLRGQDRERFLSFEGGKGRVDISTSAISDYIQRLAGEYPSVVKMRTSVIPTRRAIDVGIELRVNAGPQIQEICGQLQRRVRESMAEDLGITQVRRVDVSIRDIIS